ncbi:unnamed protein product [Candida verbasci]|uniref:DASH complex subunit SPC34 n=1 Tax=Candida verbasci TaxID=1227364 RepID=A0A9W4TZ05_9ASCO|nr:unnamed protein product [Candida verbasci]
MINNLNKINQSIRSIQSNDFNKFGVFTNSIVNLPDPIKLIKDASDDENLLYKIITIPNGDIQPIRIDGRQLYKFENLEGSNPIVKPLDLDYDSISYPLILNQISHGDLKNKLRNLINFINRYSNLIPNYPDIQNELNELIKKYNNEIREIDSLTMELENEPDSNYDDDLDDAIELEEKLIKDLESKINQLNN